MHISQFLFRIAPLRTHRRPLRVVLTVFFVCKIHDRDNRFVLFNTPDAITPRLLPVCIPIPLFKTLLDVHY